MVSMVFLLYWTGPAESFELVDNSVVVEEKYLTIKGEAYFISIRDLAEKLGAKLSWEQEKQRVSIKTNETGLWLQLSPNLWTDVLNKDLEETYMASFFSEDHFYIELDDALHYFGKDYQVLKNTVIPPLNEYTPKAVPILMYHHLMPREDMSETDLKNGAILPKENFVAQMSYLHQNNYTTITLRDLYQYFNGSKELPAKRVLITFDDGYQSNYIYAYPILKKYGFVGTQFIMTGTIEPENIVAGVIPKFSWDEINKSQDVFEFHSHTHDLHYLDQGKSYVLAKDLELVRQDLKLSLKTLKERNLGRKKAFSYPYGQYNADIINLLQELGFNMAVTVKPGKADKNQSLLELKRINITRKMSLSQFSDVLNSR